MYPPLAELGQQSRIANIVGIAVFRELGPLISAIVLTGFAGASIAAEIGTMVVGEEIEALEAHALNPIRFLVVPRVIATVISLILLVELVLLGAGWVFDAETAAVASSPTPPAADVHNTEALGLLLYTKYVYLFQGAGMILLVAMVGAIVLTHRARVGVRKQSIAAQNARLRSEAVSLKKVEPGQGI